MPRREGDAATNTYGADAVIFEWDKEDGSVGEVRLVVSETGGLSFEGVPHEDPGELGAIWVDGAGYVRASGGPQ